MTLHAATVASPFPQQALPAMAACGAEGWHSLLAADGGGCRTPRAGLAQFVSANVLAGREVVIVSSGAVAAGARSCRGPMTPVRRWRARQALAALGQAQLIGLWQRFFERPVRRCC